MEVAASDSAIRGVFANSGTPFYVLVIIVTLHWLACVWAMLAQFSQYDPRTAELADAVAARMNIDDTCSGCVDLDSKLCQYW